MQAPSRAALIGVALTLFMFGAVGVACVGGSYYVGMGWWGSAPPNLCRRMRGMGFAENCREERRGILNALAVEVVAFDVPESRASGQVMSFRKRTDYDAALLAYKLAALLGGTAHGSKSHRTIIQIGAGAPNKASLAAQAILDGLSP